MATDVRLGDIPTLLQLWQTEWQAEQADALARVCVMLQSEAKEMVDDGKNLGRLADNIETAVDGHEACVGVASHIVGDGSRDDPERDIGEEAVAREFGGVATPPMSFLGAAASRRLDDVGSGLAESLLRTFRRSVPGVSDRNS